MHTKLKFARYSGLTLALLYMALPAATNAATCGSRLAEPLEQMGVRQLAVPPTSSVSWDKESYFHGLLNLIFDATAKEYGPCELVAAPKILTRARMSQAVGIGEGIDVLWANATRERQAQMRAVPIPLLKGIMSYKISLIHGDRHAHFEAVDSLEDLRELRFGTGLDWPDAEIARASGLQVVGTNNYTSLFKMLVAGRFDLMMRGAHEVTPELKANAELNLDIAQGMIIVIPSAVYFFVNPDESGLADRLELGLRRLMENGSFDEHFYAHPSIKLALGHIEANSHRIIYLNNPLLPDDVPLGQAKYWLYPWIKNAQGQWVVKDMGLNNDIH